MTLTVVFIQLLGALALAAFSSYLGGRVHQRQREDERRRVAFRDGFRSASTLVSLTVGERPAPRRNQCGTVIPIARKRASLRGR